MGKGKSISKTTCKIRDTTFRHSMPKHEVVKATRSIDEALRATEKAVHALSSCGEIGGDQWAKHCNRLLDSEQAKLAGVTRYALKELAHQRPTLEACLECAATLDLTQPIPEPVLVYPKMKAGKTGWRPISKFGLMHNSAQEMVRTILGAAFRPRPYQFTQKGVSRAIATVRTLVAEGRQYVAHLDIESHFQRFELGKLSASLPLPQWAVEHVVCGRRLTWITEEEGQTHHSPYPLYNTILLVARLGIPQGSSASPLVSMIECSKLDLSLSIVCALANYADDFLLLASSQEELDAAIGELQAAVRALPGGHFSLKLKQSGHLKDGCDFLGHHLRLDEDGLTIGPSDANCAKLYREMNAFERQCSAFKHLTPDKEAVIQAARNATAYLDGWEHAFRECDDIEDFLAGFRKSVELMLAKVGATPEDMKPVRPKIKFDELRHIYE